MTSIDLIPFYLHRRRRILTILRQWAVAATIVVGLFSVVYGLEKERLQVVRTSADRREMEYQPIFKKQVENRRILAQLESLRSREAIAYALEDRHPALTLVLNVGQAVAETDGKLSIDSLDFDRSREERRVVTMHGQVTD
ncbi:MAG: hypothetical protein AAF497_08805, partial [Planctomycetota bacterium]